MEPNTALMEFNRYKKLKVRLELIREDINFLKNCKKYKVIPMFIENKIKHRPGDKAFDKVILEAKRRLLDLEIGKHFARAEKSRRELYPLHLKLLQNTHELIWREFRENVIQIGRYKSMGKRKIQNKKLSRLTHTKNFNKQNETKINFVINKSSKEFTREQLDLLNKGLKYKPRPLEAPVNELVVSIESSIKFSPIEEKIYVREEVAKLLESEKEIRSKNEEWKVIKELQKSECVFLNPDKGKGVVIMDTKDYVEAAEKQLRNDNFELVKSKRKYPVDAMQKEVTDELKKLKEEGFLTGKEVRKLTVPNPVIPSFSCLPKIHKEGNKVRPVVSNINSPTSEICKFLVQRFRMLDKPFSKSVKNSFQAAEKLLSEKLSEDELLISFDVESLYPSVPVEESVSLLSEWIESQDISDVDVQLYIRLVKLVMKQRWIEFQGKIYLQKEGLFIGNSLSPILAEVFMGNLEKGIESKDWFPRVWYRYVDDVVAIVKKGEESVILEELNQQHRAIRFTLEVENLGVLSFLDLKLSRIDGRLDLDIFRKPTDAPLCIPNSSHHPWIHKVAAFESAVYRMWNLPLSEENRKKELDYLVHMANVNGYQRKLIMGINRKHKRRVERRKVTTLKPIVKASRRHSSEKTKGKARHVSIPYHKTLTHKISNKLKKSGLNIVYNSKGNLRSLIGKVKKKRARTELSGIYNILCKSCDMNYIGQTKRRAETRVMEHERALRLKQGGKSAIADHCLDEKHTLGKYAVLKEVQSHFHLDAWESIFIAKGEELVNTGEPPIRSKLFDFVSIAKRDKLLREEYLLSVSNKS